MSRFSVNNFALIARTLSGIRFNNGNRTEWSPVRSVIVRVITKSDDREAARFVNHEYNYRLNWTTGCHVTNLSQQLRFPIMVKISFD